MKIPARSALISLALAGLTAGCASTGDFPSLAKRPYEGQQASPPVANEVAGQPDSALMAKLATIIGQVDAAVAPYEAAVIKSGPIISRASGAAVASEAWVAAQMELSQIERMRAPVQAATGDLNELYRQAMLAGKEADAAAISHALSKVRLIDERQSAALAGLSASVRTP